MSEWNNIIIVATMNISDVYSLASLIMQLIMVVYSTVHYTRVLIGNDLLLPMFSATARRVQLANKNAALLLLS